MADLGPVIAQLRAERDKLDHAITLLSALNGAEPVGGTSKQRNVPRAGKNGAKPPQKSGKRGSAPSRSELSHREAVLAFLKAHPGAGYELSQICDGTGREGPSLSPTLSKMKEAGLVVNDSGLWKIAKGGGAA